MKRVLKFGFHYINMYRGLYVVYLFICLLSSIIGISLPWLIGAIVNVITETQRSEILINYVLIFFIFSIIQQILSIFSNHIFLKIQSATGYSSNMQIIKKIYSTSFLNVLNEDSAMLNQKINYDCNVIVIFCISFFRDMISNISLVILVGAILISQSILLGLVLLILVFLYIMIYLFFKKYIYEASLDVKVKQTSFFGKLYSIVASMKSIRNNGFQTVFFKQQDKEFDDYYTAMHKQLVVSNKFDAMTNFISMISQIILFIYGGNMVLNHRMSVGMFVIISSYFSSLIQSTNYFLNLGESYQNVRASFNRVVQYFELPQIHYGNLKMDSINEIRFNKVSFAYPGKSDLFMFTYRLKKGNIYWIQGNNGIGKTTLINLILGLFGYDYKGEITFDGISVKDLDYQNMIEKNISIVEQYPFLLTDTFKTNLLWKCNSNEVEMNKLINEFEMQEFFNRLPMGMNTTYNALNDNISGGEKQKLAIIRLLLSYSDIWILDEPTSSLDQKSCKQFYSSIKERKDNHITIIISHDKPLEYDEIIKLSNYNVIEYEKYCDKKSFDNLGNF